MKKTSLAVILLSFITLNLSINAAFADDYKLAWYAPTVHPYFDSVKKAVEFWEKENNIKVLTQIGQEWTQDNQNQNVEAIVAQGYKGIAIYPVDASATNGLYEEITALGVHCISFGAPTTSPTTASFAVATDVKAAAKIATEKLVELIGGKGNILNVLEVLEDANTVLRKEGIEEVVAKYPDVKIIQEVAGIKTVESGTEKIQNAVSARIKDIDGIIATGYVTTVATTTILKELSEAGGKKIRFVGIDDDPIVLDAIRDGVIDATFAQNFHGHGFIPMALLKHLQDGWKPKKDAYFVDTGGVIVTKDNIDTFHDYLVQKTNEITSSLETKYLEK